MEAASRTFGYGLAWTLSLNSMYLRSPKGLGNLNWNYSLGQAYTDDTQRLYSPSGCLPSSNFWQKIKYNPPTNDSFWLSHAVPMLCGAGNCQEPLDDSNTGTCIDERLSPAVSGPSSRCVLHWCCFCDVIHVAQPHFFY